jgi:DNA-3-methyladenine glycosylase
MQDLILDLKPLPKEFYNRPTLHVAEDLIGKLLVFGEHKGVITETEAYTGQNDPACHAARGITPRTKVMFGPAGFSYVYFIYGMYHCLNFVTEEEGVGAAVLIRGIKLLDNNHYLNGPGKLCKYLGITKEHNALNITNHPEFFVADIGKRFEFITTPRIGISVAKELPWRFLAVNH